MNIDSGMAWLKRLHAADSGEVPIGPMLLVGLIVIPMVLLLVKFKDKIMDTTASGANDLLNANTHDTSQAESAITGGK